MNALPDFHPARPVKPGTVSLVGAGPGAADLLTLRALNRIRRADVILYDRLIAPDVLELAQPDTELVFAGKEVGHHAWPQERINGRMLEEALKGREVARLKSGDPGIFGRAGEELATLEAAGIRCEIIPGVTAACASAAEAGRPLTERGIADTLVLTTGMCRDGDPLPDAAKHARPGTTIAFYMSVRQADRISAGLMARGLAGDTQVTIAANATKADARHLTCPLDKLAETLAQAGITGCATLIVTWPKPAETRQPTDAAAAASA